MAGFQVDYTDARTQLTIPNARVYIAGGSFSLKTHRLTLSVEVYATAEAMRPALATTIVFGEIDPEEPIQPSALYEYLKGLPQFAGAVDL